MLVGPLTFSVTLAPEASKAPPDIVSPPLMVDEPVTVSEPPVMDNVSLHVKLATELLPLVDEKTIVGFAARLIVT
jgi:hypothetical protein